MQRLILLILFSVTFICLLQAQQPPPVHCGQQEVTEKLLRDNPILKRYQETAEQQLRQYNAARKQTPATTQRTAAVVTLPVVVHIIHNNGAENISNAQVLAGIQHLNEAFANTGYYDPANGVNTQIQFCLAQRDPNNNPTNGITRDISAYTTMGGPDHYTDDQAVKNINRWNPSCYINIWLVRSIPGSVAGYAYLPTAHGSNLDGIVMEANWFGSSHTNSVVTIHEMGHYLGLYHTFQGACKNDDCTVDGDRVCDTPPDQSTSAVSCNTSVNSCSSDALSGFGADVDDLKEDYMDYGNFDCMKVFTQGQADRMNWFIQNTRNSLLQCKSCMIPCPAPVTAGFTTSATAVSAGSTVTFTNTSVNAASYRWYINNVLQSTGINYAPAFNTTGTYTIKMVAANSDPLCDSAFKTAIITVTCPLTINFTPPDTVIAVNTTLTFLNTTTGATSYSWQLNGIPQSTALNFTQAFTTPGNYAIQLKASNGFCTDSLTRTVVVAGACQQQNFQRTYGGQRSDIISDIRSTPDGGYIVAGRTASFGGGDEDGFLLKIDQLGAVQWSQTYGATRTDGFYRVILTSDGGYMAVGQTKSYGYLSGAAWVVKTDAAGNLQWNRQFGENSTYGEIASNVIQASDGSYYITGRQNNNPGVGNVLVIKLDGTGTLLWSKIFDDSDSDNGTSIMEDNGGILVSGTSRSTTWHDAFLMKLDVNGNIQWSKKYDVGGRNNAAGAAFTRQGNFYLMPLVTINDFTNTNTGRAMMLRIDLNGDAVEVKEIIAPDYVYGSTGTFTPTPDGGYLFQQSEDNGNADLNLIKLSPAGTVEWTRKFIQPGNQYTYTLRPTPDGGYISAGYTTTGGNDMYIVKTDAQGNIPACNSTNVQIQVNTPPFTTNAFTWFDERNSHFTAVPHPVMQPGIATIPSTLLCAGTPCTPPPTIDTCKTTTFVKLIGSNGRETASDIKTTAQGDFIIAGGITQHKAAPDRDALLIKVNREGTILWQKAFGSPELDIFNNLLITSDDHIITLGQFNSHILPDGTLSRELLVSKFDQQGSMVWSKSIQNQQADPSAGQIQNMHQMIGTSDSGIVISFSSYDANRFFLAKLTKNGNLAWFKTVVANNGLSPTRHFTAKGDTLFLSVTDDAVIGNAKALLLLLNHRTGNAIGGKRFTSLEAPSFVIFQMEQTATGFTATGTLTEQWGSFYIPVMLQFDFNANLLSAVKIPTLDLHYNTKMAQDPSFMALTNIAKDSNIVYRMTPEGLPKWSYRYKIPGTTQTTANITMSNDQAVVVAGTINSATTANDIYLVKTSQNGIAPACFFNNVPITTQPTPLQVSSYSPGTYDFINYQITNLFYNELPVNLAVTNICDATAGLCNQLTITGPDTSCNLIDTLDFIVDKNLGCGYSVDWAVDTNMVRIVAVSDTTIRLLPKQYGQVQLRARIKMPCAEIGDTIDIRILHPVTAPNLGPDIQLCTNSTYTLHAGPGFHTYQWQDGSADSTFTAYRVGLYHILATDYCNKPYRDTIIISQAPPVPFDLGPDLERCSNDTLQLSAPTGFTNYRWSGNYMISSIYGQTVRIFTDRDTLYSVTAEKGPGCIVIDTIRVKVKPTASLNLGNDTSFCQNETITLDAGPGFSNYTWNTGANTQQITIGTAGNFFVNATNANGCISKDTLRVTNVFALPVVKLGNDTILCVNSSVTFRAGAGFTAYQWQDGSTGAAFTATQPGVYWVKVTDQHTCANADTVAITDIKACLKGLYLPNAFSPNNDHNNDLFRPTVYGYPEKYRLTIYNRWGQRIFETTDIYKGWDGTINGKPQDTGMFVWTCQYKLVGMEEKSEKGVLTLVR